MVEFTGVILKSDKKGGWSYIIVPKKYAHQIKPETKTSFRVKGRLDKLTIEKTSLMPSGDGNFILPINAGMRKKTGKKAGDKLKVSIELDTRRPALSKDLMACLKDDPEVFTFFKSLSRSNQQYFSQWVEDAKTVSTKSKRITITLLALNKKMDYTRMVQAMKTFEL